MNPVAFRRPADGGLASSNEIQGAGETRLWKSIGIESSKRVIGIREIHPTVWQTPISAPLSKLDICSMIQGIGKLLALSRARDSTGKS